MFAGVALMLLVLIINDTVKMIKQFPQSVHHSLAFHGDVVYIGSWLHIIQWNVATDAVVRLEGFPSLILIFDCPAWFYVDFRLCLWSRLVL